MSAWQPLVVEILSGPLDGATVTLEADAEWSRAGNGPLAFPWDFELGEPQARFIVAASGWWLEGLDAPYGTYVVNREIRISEKVQLERGDILKAGGTWLLVRQV